MKLPVKTSVAVVLPLSYVNVVQPEDAGAEPELGQILTVGKSASVDP